jgi:hypothetical protein
MVLVVRAQSPLRNLLDESSVARSLDGDRLIGCLRFSATDF